MHSAIARPLEDSKAEFDDQEVRHAADIVSRPPQASLSVHAFSLKC
jgi:hypothetical protein